MSDQGGSTIEDIQYVKIIVSRIFPSSPSSIERVTEGGSTWVYRITCEHETFYLRVLPEEGASLAPEVTVHLRLREMNVKVLEAIYFEAHNDLFQRSIMLTSETPGQPVSQSSFLPEETLANILRQAGRDLAIINAVPVEGFGWIRRNLSATSELCAPWSTYRAFALEFWESDLNYLISGKIISRVEAAQLEHMLLQHDFWLDGDHASLAHGDLDANHIYQEDGRYTGIIDFGEIRGTDRWYDLGHFHLQVQKQLSPRLEAALVSGYREIVGLDADYQARISFASLLISLRALARSLQKRPPDWYTQYLAEMLRKELTKPL